jgi:hypothetical protein
MADEIILEDQDTITDDQLARATARSNTTDYIESGIVPTDNGDGTAAITAGQAVIQEGTRAYTVRVDARPSLSLPASSGTNYIYLTIDPDADSDAVSYEVNTSGSAPANPSLLVAIDDAAAGTAAQVNPDPSGSYQSVDVTGEMSSGSVTTEHSVTETLGYDYSQQYPQHPNQPVSDGPPAYRPHPGADNPVLTADDAQSVIGGNVEFVADPFAVFDSETGLYHMWMEVSWDSSGGTSFVTEIGHATSPDGVTWTFNQICNHGQDVGAYPMTFKVGGEWYQTPTNKSNDAILFKATNFPTEWSAETTLFTSADAGHNVVDFTPLKWDNVWYGFVSTGSSSGDGTGLWYSEDGLLGNWQQHPSSPIKSGSDIPRPAGRPLVYEDYIDFFYMDNTIAYGAKTRCFRISELTPSTYSDSEVATSPVVGLTYNERWNHNGMHHIDHIPTRMDGSPIVIVDGISVSNEWAIGAYTTADKPQYAAKAHLNSTQDISSTAVLQFVNRDFDYADAWDTTNYGYVAPVSGKFRFNLDIEFGNIPAGSAPNGFNIRLYNDTQDKYLKIKRIEYATEDGFSGDFSVPADVDAGDLIVASVNFASISGSITAATQQNGTYMEVEYIGK